MAAHERELALRAHIRSLLLNYSLTHLTRNYVMFTQDAVAELLSESLTYVSTTDPTALALPIDPFDQLTSRWRLDKLEDFDERWRINEPQAVQFIRQNSVFPERPASNRCWNDDADDDYKSYLLYRPVSPALTTLAIRQTPKLGAMSSTELLPQSHNVLLKSFSISDVVVDDISEQAPLKPDDAMENKLPLDADTHKAIVELLSSVPALSRGIAASHNIAPLDNFLRSDSPIPEYPGRYSPPIFSRDRRPGHRTSFTSILTSTETKRPSGLNTMSDLPSFVPKVTVKEEEEDLDDQHLVIVNGWQAYEIPSSPLSAGTPSLGDCSSQVDELFLPSPPDSEPVLQSLMLAKMDEHEFARSEKIGGACIKRKLLSESASFGAFMSTMLPRPQARDNRVRIATSPKSHPSSPHTPITASMLGQPPSAIFGPNDVDHDRTQRACLDFDDDRLYSDDGKDLNAIVEQVCGERVGEDPTDIIMKEKLDEKDGMLMDVPHLHPPNVHPSNALFLPTCMLELLTTQGPDATRVGNGDVIKVADTGFLRKIKGFMPLQIELTWRPFKFGPTKPTDEEVTNVADNPRDELANDIELNGEKVLLEVSRLLDETTALCIDSTDHSDNSPSARSWQADSSGMDLRGMVEFDSETHEMILTAEERRRLHGLPDVVQLQDEEMDSGCSDKENDPLTLCSGQRDDMHRSKRVRFDDRPIDHEVAENEHAAQVNFDAFIDPHSYEEPPDDSGIFLETFSGRNSSFRHLAYDAEGFEGPDRDGNPPPDVHPVHDFDFASFSPGSQERILSRIPATPTDYPAPALATSNLDAPSADAPSPGVAWTDDDGDGGFHFLPLSFDSTQQQSAFLPPGAVDAPKIHHNDPSLTRTSSRRTIEPAAPSALCSPGAATSRLQTESRQPSPTDAYSDMPPTLPVVSARQSLIQFLALCGKGCTIDSHTPAMPSRDTAAVPEEFRDLPASKPPLPQGIPEDLFDHHTLRLNDVFTLPNTVHRYMASMNFIQMRAVVRSLSSRKCAVDLVERESLCDVHLILDPDTAVLFVSLETLPSQCELVTTRLLHLSWRYLYLLVIFEGYSASLSYKAGATRNIVGKESFSYFPPIVKAIKKLRRDLGIADAFETKRPGVNIYYAFASSAEESAMFARAFGDSAQARDCTGGSIWGERLWLEVDEQEDERDLSGVNGMNPFAASIVLSQMTLEDLLEKTPEERVDIFADLIGAERIICFNNEIARRIEAMQLPPSSPSNEQYSSHSSVHAPELPENEGYIYT